MTDTKYPEDLLNLENIGIYGDVLKLGYHELLQKLYDAIEYGYMRGRSVTEEEWINFTALVNSSGRDKIDFLKLNGCKVKITNNKGTFTLYGVLRFIDDYYSLECVSSVDDVDSYFLEDYEDTVGLLRDAWIGYCGTTLWVSGNILKKQRTADKLVAGERVSLRSLITDEFWRDVVCVHTGTLVGYSDKSNGLEIINKDLENIVVEEELGVFDIS